MRLRIHIEPFRLALKAAQAELTEVEAQFAALAKDRDKLQATVDSLSSLLSSVPENNAVTVVEPTQKPTPATGPKRGPSDTASWRVTQDLFLSTRNQPLTMPEIQEQLAGRGFVFDQRTIRSGMARKPGLFKQVGFGKWQLQHMPNGPVFEVTEAEMQELEKEYADEETGNVVSA